MIKKLLSIGYDLYTLFHFRYQLSLYFLALFSVNYNIPWEEM